MKKILIVVLIVLGVFSIFLLQKKYTIPTQLNQRAKDAPKVSVVAQNLDTPWALAFLPDKSILVTERPGRLRLIDANGILSSQSISINGVREIGEGGLLGVAVDPEYSSNHYIYLYYTFGSIGENTRNRVSRFTFENNSLGNEQIIVDNIPSNSNHNGGRIKFGPDGLLYITTGDGEEPSRAQNKDSLGGKILRVKRDGNPVPDNPFGSRVYSYGHRNPQGITWDNEGNMWETEHGRSFPISGLDEINLIVSGANYGWPTIQGNERRAGMVMPQINSGGDTWAPSGIAYLNGSLFFGGLRGESLYEVSVNGKSVSDLKKHFNEEYGRLRDVVVGPDGLLYVTTSNQDGRGNPKDEDDRILKINPTKL